MVSSPEEWPAFTTHMEEFRRSKIFFPNFKIGHISRAQNTMADKLAHGARNSPSAMLYVDSIPPVVDPFGTHPPRPGASLCLYRLRSWTRLPSPQVELGLPLSDRSLGCTTGLRGPGNYMRLFLSSSSFISPASMITIVAFLIVLSTGSGADASIGVNYGTLADNLPPPRQVAEFLLHSTVINRIRLFNADPQILQAFAHTGVAVTVTVSNDQIPHLTNLSFAQRWISDHIQPHFPSTNIIRILVGNEVISTADHLLVRNLVPAMQSLHTALVSASLHRRIQISTPHSLGILSHTTPPSSSRFRQGYDTHVLKPLLSFLRTISSPFVVNPYPFFGYSPETLDFALFRPNPGLFDHDTKLHYTNMFDAQLDSVYSAMDRLGFSDVAIVVRNRMAVEGRERSDRRRRRHRGGV
ncbi:hypothetical protein Rs2_42562 [Raphanus sativus]|nr:hypothetical protein Rs2_42562 [Raphanus sativus]